MIKKVFISAGFNNTKNIAREINLIKNTLIDLKIDFILFIESYKFSEDQEKEMMKNAFLEIDKCDLLIAEVSNKSIGVGIEIGYAKAKKIPVLYLRKKNAEHSTTASGSANYSIIYSSQTDLRRKLKSYIKKVDEK